MRLQLNAVEYTSIYGVGKDFLTLHSRFKI
jgi:hypothetical protein